MTTHALLSSLLLLGATTARSATADRADGREDAPAAPAVTVIGQTRDFDQLAVEGEYHLGRFSVFADVGWMPPSDSESARLQGIALFAGGGRVFTSGLRSRGFLELSYGPQGRALKEEPSGRADQFLVYGPNMLLGYQRIASSGLTFLAAAGWGFGRSSNPDLSFNSAQLRLGLGFTWRSQGGRSRASTATGANPRTRGASD